MENALDKQIWRGLVNYVNADDLEHSSESLRKFADTLLKCFPWMARTPFGWPAPSDPLVLIATHATADRWVEDILAWPAEGSAEQFRTQATKYQPLVRTVLTWLADPARQEEARSAAWGFLQDHMLHVQFRRGDPADAPEQEGYRYWDAKDQLKVDFPFRTQAYQDIADPICDFIYRQQELWKEPPIRVCKRERCGNLVARFKKRQYCRTPSCDEERQKRVDDLMKKKNRDNVFLWRLRKMHPGPRRDHARKNAPRLREIRGFWRGRNQSLARNASNLLDEVR